MTVSSSRAQIQAHFLHSFTGGHKSTPSYYRKITTIHGSWTAGDRDECLEESVLFVDFICGHSTRLRPNVQGRQWRAHNDVRKGLLNAHYLIVCKTLQQYVVKEKYTGEEFHQSMCPFHLLSLICRCNKHYSVVPMLLSQSPSWSVFKRELRKKMKIWGAIRTDMQGVTTLPDAVTRIPPSLLLRNSMLPVEPHYSMYCNVAFGST